MEMVVKQCNCQHSYQDEKLGHGNRYYIHAKTKDVSKYSCTVCGKEHRPSAKK